MIRSILVPFDGSAFSEQALSLARRIARRAGAQLHFSHVVMPLILGDPMMQYTTLDVESPEQSKAYLSDLVKRLCETDESPVTAVMEGSVSDALADYVTTNGIDLVVMATHGRGPLGRALAGSIADELLRAVGAPVILVRAVDDAVPHRAVAAGEFHHILLALDGTPQSEEVLGPATELARLFGAELTLLHVLSPGASSEHHLTAHAERLRKRGLNVHTLVVPHDDPAEAILQEAKRIGVDLIAMETHARAGLVRLFRGSVSDRVAREAHCPVLIHHGPKTAQPSGSQPMDAQELITVYQTPDLALARIVAADLNNAGIACSVSGENQGGFTGIGVMDIDVTVRAIDADRARRIIESNEPREETDTVPK